MRKKVLILLCLFSEELQNWVIEFHLQCLISHFYRNEIKSVFDELGLNKHDFQKIKDIWISDKISDSN